MKNPTVKEFCEKHGAYPECAEWAAQFETMEECFDALLDREVNEDIYIQILHIVTVGGIAIAFIILYFGGFFNG